MSDLLYLYAVLPAASPAVAWLSRNRLSGIAGAPLRALCAQALAAAVSGVPADEYEEEPLNQHIRNLAWLGPRAAAHQEVNARLFELADTVLPLSFGAVY